MILDNGTVDIGHKDLFTLSESIMYNSSGEHLRFRHGQIDTDVLGILIFW